ncbi:unnamed protein product [Malus baccata var. baccata]
MVLVVTNTKVAPLYLDKVDSSVGSKTAINHSLGKNLIGAFYQPQCTLIDTDTLNTLPDRELASGLAEAIKCGLVRDADFFEGQERNSGNNGKSESGVRAILNLGHTFGHMSFCFAKETGVGNGNWLHGEAVAAGTVRDLRIACVLGYRLVWIDDALSKLPIAPAESVTIEMFRPVMAVREWQFLLKGPLGNCVFTGEYDRKALDETLHAFWKS